MPRKKRRRASPDPPANVRKLLAEPALLSSLLEHLAGRPEVQQLGWRITEKRLSPRPCAERDAAICRDHLAGRSYSAIARRLNMTRAAVAKICQRGRLKIGVDNEPMSTAPRRYAS